VQHTAAHDDDDDHSKMMSSLKNGDAIGICHYTAPGKVIT
jgi:hypothetical protein